MTLDVDKVVDSMIDDILPPTENLDKPEPEIVEEKPEPKEVKEEIVADPEEKVEEKKVELKPGDEGYVAPPVVEAPKSWSKEMAPEYVKLPQPVRDYLKKREDDYTNGISQYKQAAEYARAVHSVVSPYMAHLNARGVDVPTALKTLLNADYTLTNADPDTKAMFFTNLMKHYKVDQAKLGATQNSDPAVAAMQTRLAQTEGRLTEFQAAQQEGRRKEVAKAVDTFAADPKNLYFGELSDDIVKLINAGYTLEEAYEKAVWANPVTRAKEQARTSKDAEEKRKKDAAEAALAAKKAARSNVKDTPSSRTAPTSLLGSMDDTLRTTMRAIKERSN